MFPVGSFLVGHPFLLAIDETGELYQVMESIATYGPMPGALDILMDRAPAPLFAEPAPMKPESGAVAKWQRRYRRTARAAYRR